MKKNCSLCGNIYHNTTFRGGFICEDCLNYIKETEFSYVSKPASPEASITSDI
ncbi:MAG TPA: hypothetical protein IAB13_01520 [Candidatus Avanaerovorax faecigallinarum]|nr:hypothetical protein [Candidatus Avanaerovorax faecigallinarum]